VGGLYLYSNQMGCDGDRLYFDGSAMISLNGHLLAQSPQFSVKQVEVITSTIDLDLIQILRGNRPSFTNQSAASNNIFPFQYSRIDASNIILCHSEFESFKIPVTQVIEPFYHPEDEEIGLGPALWMWDYLRKSGAGGFYIPLSGGLDSASCALIVYTMCRKLAEDYEFVSEDLNRILGEGCSNDPREICRKFLYTCYLGTTNSTDSSRQRAQNLANAINS
jgi:NAD+ synthase (glutamine-hydrolysing)